MNSLLDDLVFHVRIGESTQADTLPGVLARLSLGQDLVFLRLRPHQEHAWFMFLAQLGALALDELADAPRTSVDPRWAALDAAWWRASLVRLAGGDERAWHLVAPLDAPAFLQPPVPEGTLDGFGNRYVAADELDLLVTAKNHDLKTRRQGSATADDWVYALVSLQTGEGYGGRGNHGVMRMNGGLGNRPHVALNTTSGWGVRFREDVARLLAGVEPAFERLQSTGDVRLVGLAAWDGTSSYSPTVIHPYAIEVCRRVRIAVSGSGWEAHAVASDKPRIDAKALLGNVADPWTPLVVDGEGVKSLTVSGSGFTYKLVRDVLFKLTRPACLGAIPGVPPGPRVLHLTALVRGQGKTEGLHRRTVPIPARAALAMGNDDAARRWAERSEAQVKDVGEVQSGCLRPAIRMLLDGGVISSRPKDPRVDRWTDAFQHAVDAVFFAHLFSDSDDPAAIEAWRRVLFDLASAQLDAACHGAPVPAARRPKAVANARSLFRAAFRKRFGALPVGDVPSADVAPSLP